MIAAHETETRRAAFVTAAETLKDIEREFLVTCLKLGSAAAAQRALGWPPGAASNAAQRRTELIGRLRRAIPKEPVQ